MNPRVLAGSILAFGYNGVVGRLPSRVFRWMYLRAYLGGLGPGTGVQMGCHIYNGRKVFLGAHTVINHGCLLDGRRHAIRIGDNASIGPEAVILTLGHDPQSPDFELRGGEVNIGDRVFIGYRAMILPAIQVGEGAVVGAGAVVTKNVAPYTIVAGNPARVIGERSRDLRYELNFKPFLQ